MHHCAASAYVTIMLVQKGKDGECIAGDRLTGKEPKRKDSSMLLGVLTGSSSSRGLLTDKSDCNTSLHITRCKVTESVGLMPSCHRQERG